MKSYGLRLTHSTDVAAESVRLCREEARDKLGYPLAKKPTVIMYRLGKDLQDEARRVARHTMADWERAGSPWLDPQRIAGAHQSVLAQLRIIAESAH